MGKNAVFMARVDGCAWILRTEKKAKMAQIMSVRNVDEATAARMYVLGALKAAVRRGSSATIADALDRFEEEQIGDRSVSVKAESSILAEVRRIDAANETRTAKGSAHRKNMGKVLGTIYVEWEASEESSAVDVTIEREGYEEAAVHIDSVISAYIDEYVTRLSDTAKGTIKHIVKSHYDTAAIMAGKDKETAKLRECAKYLHRNFPKASVVTTRELIDILRKYAA
jgi:hypothetical protein